MFRDPKHDQSDREINELAPCPSFVGTSMSEEDEGEAKEDAYWGLCPTRELESWPPPPSLRKSKNE